MLYPRRSFIYAKFNSCSNNVARIGSNVPREFVKYVPWLGHPPKMETINLICATLASTQWAPKASQDGNRMVYHSVDGIIQRKFPHGCYNGPLNTNANLPSSVHMPGSDAANFHLSPWLLALWHLISRAASFNRLRCPISPSLEERVINRAKTSVQPCCSQCFQRCCRC